MPRPTARPSGWPRAHPDVRVVRLERNGGFCAAANAGIAAARGRFIQLLNNDTEVDRRLDRGGPGPVRRSDGRLGRAAGPGPIRPGPGGFGRRFLRPGRLADQARPRPARGALCRPAGRRGLRRQRIECVLPAGGAAPRRRLRSASSDRITRTSTWPSACAGPVIAACLPRGA